MIKKILFTSFCSILLLSIANAGTPFGGQVTYRYLSNNKFEVTYKVYKDCRGIPLSIPTYAIRCASSGATKTLTATRISIIDITAICASASKPCSPTSTGTLGLEEHTYMDTLDFNGSESAFKSCCIIQIGVGQCCRHGAITTGAAGNDFWVFSTLDLCKAATNSSPIFSFKPAYLEIANENMMKSYFAKDTIDNDSLSYSFTDPMSSWGGKTNWAGGFDSKNPFSVYYPTGYNRALGPKPEANPPIGIYLDPTTGNLICKPVSSNEYSIMAIAVKEWRKDSNGKYIQIGEIVMENGIFLISNNNHTPTLGGKLEYKICEGEKFILDITTDDQPFNFPPPTTAARNDTVVLTWDNNIKNAKFTIANPNVKLPVGKFEWTPATGDSKKLPYKFTAIATDNACPFRSITYKTIKLQVYPKISVSSAVKKINSSTYAIGINISNKKYSYVTGKFISSIVTADARNYYFKSSNSPYSTNENDTLVFKRNGTYIISQSFLSETECNNTSIKDTIVIDNLLEVTLGINSLGIYSDTSFCQNQSAGLYSKVTNAKLPITYIWKAKNKNLTDTFGYFINGYSADDTVFLSVKDAAGNTNSTFRVVKVLDIPSISAGPDKTICPGTIENIRAKKFSIGNVFWEWYNEGAKISSVDSIAISAPANYMVKATNANGCAVSDTMVLGNFKLLKIDLLSGEYCQDKNELIQNEIFSVNPNLQFGFISWAIVKTLQKPAGGFSALGDLLVDDDPSSKYNYKIMFDESRVLIPTGLKDSIILRANATDTNGCKSVANITISIIKKPAITFGSSSVDVCINKTLDLALSGSTSGTHSWVPLNSLGYGLWPDNKSIDGDTIAGGYFKTPGTYKIRFDAKVQFCSNNDSFLINVLALPKPKVTVNIINEAVRFKDITVGIKSRKWFINNSLFSVSDTLLASKSFINTQPVKLEITNSDGCTNDTIMFLKLGAVNLINRSKIEVYPNPAFTFLILKQAENWISTGYEIYDAVGKKVLSGTTKTREEFINIQNIEKGIYFLNYNKGAHLISIPFIKAE